jgi:hypothetical protein
MPWKRPIQLNEFKQAARELGTYNNEKRSNEKPTNIVRIKREARAVVHASDCAVYDAPAMPPEPCTCGAETAGK